MMIPFDFACNDDHGYYSGRVAKIALPASALEIDAKDMDGPVFRPVRGTESIHPQASLRQRLQLQVSRRRWNARHVRSHVGNIYWERFAIDEAERFLFWLRGCGLFTLDGGWEELADWFDKPTLTPFDGYYNDIERAWLRGKLIEAVQQHKD